SGPRGHFRLTAFTPPPGRYAIAVAAHGVRAEAGSLVVRPLVLAAVGDVTLGDHVASGMAAHGTRYPWLSVAPILRGADIAAAGAPHRGRAARGLPRLQRRAAARLHGQPGHGRDRARRPRPRRRGRPRGPSARRRRRRLVPLGSGAGRLADGASARAGTGGA